jgi:hypothetical protein
MNANIYICIIVIVAAAILYHRQTYKYENFEDLAQSSNQPANPLGYGQLPFYDMPVDKELMRTYWGPYLWGFRSSPFYEYGIQTSAPYPYQFECDDFATKKCVDSCAPHCYKENYLQCASGAALVDPQAGLHTCAPPT